VLSVFGQEAKRKKLAMLPFYFADLRVIKLPWFRHCHIAYSQFSANLQFQSGLFVFMKRLDLVVMHTSLFLFDFFCPSSARLPLLKILLPVIDSIVHFCSYLIYAKKKFSKKIVAFLKIIVIMFILFILDPFLSNSHTMVCKDYL